MTDFDMTESLAAKSDQLNAADLVGGPVTVTIKEVRKGNAEQPFHFHLAEMPGRPYKPSKGMRRVIVAAWGPKTSTYPGRRMTLFNEPTVRWAGEEIGGIRVSHLSHIDTAVKTSLTISKTKKEPYTVQPLPDAPAAPSEPTAEEVAACTDLDLLRGDMWRTSGPERREQIKVRAAELNGAAS